MKHKIKIIIDDDVLLDSHFEHFQYNAKWGIEENVNISTGWMENKSNDNKKIIIKMWDGIENFDDNLNTKGGQNV